MAIRQRTRSARLLVVTLVAASLAIITVDYRGGDQGPLDAAGRRVTADGSRGQFAFMDRDLDVVVVKTSAWPYDDWLVDRQLRDLSYLGLPEIARAAAGIDSREKEVTS